MGRFFEIHRQRIAQIAAEKALAEAEEKAKLEKQRIMDLLCKRNAHIRRNRDHLERARRELSRELERIAKRRAKRKAEAIRRYTRRPVSSGLRESLSYGEILRCAEEKKSPRAVTPVAVWF